MWSKEEIKKYFVNLLKTHNFTCGDSAFSNCLMVYCYLRTESSNSFCLLLKVVFVHE